MTKRDYGQGYLDGCDAMWGRASHEVAKAKDTVVQDSQGGRNLFTASRTRTLDEVQDGLDDIAREMVAAIGNPATSIEDAVAMLFENKIVWVTGGGSGIGQAMALEFAAQGAKLVSRVPRGVWR